MHHANFGEIEKQRQGAEPVQKKTFLIGPGFKFLQCRMVLHDVLWIVRPEVFSSPFRVLCVESYRVEFMVSHDDPRSALFHHLARDSGGFDIGCSTVNEIADENSCTGGVAIGATGFSVAHLLEQSAELACVSVHVTDNVVSQYYPQSFSTGSKVVRVPIEEKVPGGIGGPQIQPSLT